MLVYFPRIGGITTDDEPPYGNAVAMVGLMLLTPKSNGSCTKQV
jgi:hypothetical protein